MPTVPANSPFRPHPLLPGGLVQTLAGMYLPWPYPPHRAAARPIRLSDGDVVVLHDDQPPDWRDGGAIALLLHGLAGCHQSGYMRRVAHKLKGRGVRVMRLDWRGCGAGEGRARWPHHCGRRGDLAEVLGWIARRHADSPVVVVGFSLGGTIALNLAATIGELDDKRRLGQQEAARSGGPETKLGREAAPGGIPASCRNLAAVMAICPPIDLLTVSAFFRSPAGRKFDRYFTRRLWQQTLRRAARYPDVVPLDRPVPQRMRDFDQRVIAPVAGFDSAEAYYHATSPARRIRSIRLPTRILAAADDPIVAVEPLRTISANGCTQMTVTRSGGHLGFVGRGGADPDRRWHDWRAVEWVLAHAASGDA